MKSKEIIKDLANTDWGKDNESQMKAVELLKGLSHSDEEISNKFMKALSDASTTIGKKLTGSDEVKESTYQSARFDDVTNRASDLV